MPINAVKVRIKFFYKRTTFFVVNPETYIEDILKLIRKTFLGTLNCQSLMLDLLIERQKNKQIKL